MAAILTDDIFKCILSNEDDTIRIKFSLKLVPRSPIDNKPAFGPGIGLAPNRRKPLIEPMLTEFTDRCTYAALGGYELKRISTIALSKTAVFPVR